ncbi:uncharacterized protein LOC110453381 [Mizuhopecten yessoensis]|uniref:DUF4291 domain-containing protein n=1 Tax=Mizuhopecten yessoensis TaxID=6573 RepID=A0A210R753_MIZYE|nr:uncharacterized protein LOC110453381 [Mizuhopecten yessoensis]OWF56805.1 hypothetical protein KP79_PYT16046 [Mizuhopecten yessoensis]
MATACESHSETKSDVVINVSKQCSLTLKQYDEQKRCWPKIGRHILATFDEKTIIVYQAFKPAIAKYAVENQRFGGPDFQLDRMSWIKTSFLWMMYRCGWATKHNQERVLAVRITRDGFEEILANAYTVEFQKARQIQTKDIRVRLQWDPDHGPSYSNQQRKAIQLGLKGEILQKYSSDWIVNITDITDLVKSMKSDFDAGGAEKLWTPKEIIYNVSDNAIRERINLSSVSDCEEDQCSETQLPNASTSETKPESSS